MDFLLHHTFLLKLSAMLIIKRKIHKYWRLILLKEALYSAGLEVGCDL